MFEIVDLHISSVNFNIAWVKFTNEEIVRSIFRNSAIVQSNNLNIFPVIPSCGIDRKKAIEKVLKEVQRYNSIIRYQIRLGERDFKVFMKTYIKGEYEAYREIPIEIIDPHEEFPPIKSVTTNTIPE